jgi:hypothetical protein
MDESGEAAYLGTDKIENVGWYQHYGFNVMETTLVVGVPNWFM